MNTNQEHISRQPPPIQHHFGESSSANPFLIENYENFFAKKLDFANISHDTIFLFILQE